jgi:hypothetical protein
MYAARIDEISRGLMLSTYVKVLLRVPMCVFCSSQQMRLQRRVWWRACPTRPRSAPCVWWTATRTRPTADSADTAFSTETFTSSTLGRCDMLQCVCVCCEINIVGAKMICVTIINNDLNFLCRLMRRLAVECPVAIRFLCRNCCLNHV